MFIKIASIIYNSINYYLLKLRFTVIYYSYIDYQLLQHLSELIYKQDMLLTLTEATQIYEMAKGATKLEGDFAEVGVYKGGSALIISKVKGDKTLHLFDTFTGLPKVSKIDTLFQKGQYAADLSSIKRKFSHFKNVKFYPGFFPQTAKKLNRTFAFVHLDVDIYSSTKDSLAWFYPRMTKGGILISHDYPVSLGVKKAFDEFFKDKPEAVIKTAGTQGFIIKS